MNYEELIEKTLRGRSVRKTAEVWGVPQATLDKYMRGVRTPDVHTILKIIDESGVPATEVLEVIAAHERNHSVKNFKLQMGFARSGFVALIAAISMAVTLFLTTHPATAANMRLSEQPNAHAINYAK